MVDSAFSMTRSGVRDWLWQRISSIVLTAYVIFLVGYFCSHPQLDYYDWAALFSQQAIRYFTLVTLVCLLAHSWVGVWTIVTDYIKSTALRSVVLSALLLALMVYLFWGLDIIFKWGFTTWL